MNDDGDKQEAEEYAESLSRASRIWCGAIGASALVAGAVAVFCSTNSVGTGVLLAIGAGFAIMAATGASVSRLKLGDAEIELRQRVKKIEGVVAEALDDTSGDDRIRVAQAVADAGLPPRDRLTRHANAVLYEYEVQAAIVRLGGMVASMPSMDFGVDLIAEYKGRHIPVVVKAYQHPVPRAVFSDVERYATTSGVGTVLIVASAPPTPSAAAAAADSRSPVAFAHWSSPADDQWLREVLDRIAASSAS